MIALDPSAGAESLARKANGNHVAVVRAGSEEQIGQALGYSQVSAVAFTDANMAEAFRRIARSQRQG